MFKDEYLLDFINTENLGLEIEDIDERVVERKPPIQRPHYLSAG